MKKTAIAIALAALLSACATGQKDLPVSSLRFDYVTSGGRELGLVRAFDDGAHTALQFNVDLPRELQVFDAKGQPLAYQQVGQTAVLPGLYSPLRVQIGQRAHDVALDQLIDHRGHQGTAANSHPGTITTNPL